MKIYRKDIKKYDRRVTKIERVENVKQLKEQISLLKQILNKMNLIKNLRKPYLSMFLASLILTVSCSQYDDSEMLNLNNESEQVDNTVNMMAKTSYSGEQLFKSLFFASVDLNLDITHINKINQFRQSLTQNELEQLDYYSNLIIEEIKKDDRTYFEDFKNDLTSKDLYKIKNALGNAGDKIGQSMMNIQEIREEYILSTDIVERIPIEDYTDAEGNFDSEAFEVAIENEYGNEVDALIGPTFIGVWLVAALVQTVVVAVNYWVGVFASVYTPWDDKLGLKQEESQLQNDILVNEIYEKL